MISSPVILGSFQDLVSIITLRQTRILCKKKDGCIKSIFATYACMRLALAREQNMNVGRRTNRERQLALAHNHRLYSASSMQPMSVPRWTHPKRVLPRFLQLRDVLA